MPLSTSSRSSSSWTAAPKLYPTPECSDDGGDGQVLAQGVAVKWKGGATENGSWAVPQQKRAAREPVVPAPVPAAEVVAPPASDASVRAIPPGAEFATAPDEPGAPSVAAPAASAPAASAAASPSNAADSGNAPATVQPATVQPVTVQMEDYDPNKNLLSAPGPAVNPAPVTVPVTAPVSPPPPQPAASSSSRLPYADPRAVPGTFQPAFP